MGKWGVVTTVCLVVSWDPDLDPDPESNLRIEAFADRDFAEWFVNELQRTGRSAYLMQPEVLGYLEG